MQEQNSEEISSETITAAESMLRSLDRHGVQYMFANYGTDHTPLLEAAARIREDDPDAIPKYVVCPHEVVALGAAHGYAAVTGEPQAVVVHVDVGTQNLGGAVHNAHRGDAPVFIVSGLAPVSEGDHPGARDNTVHYLQDVFDQEGIVREYCRWYTEYRPPMNPDEVVARGLEQATSPRPGPVYVTATREALEEPVSSGEHSSRSVRSVRSTGPDPGTVSELAELFEEAERPLVITSKLALPSDRGGVDTLVEFAEAAGAGVVEYGAASLCFPRDHDLHAGFDPSRHFGDSDLVLAVDVDVPWLPRNGSPSPETTTVQVDVDPTKPAYPKWDFQFDRTVIADPIETLEAVTDAVDPDTGATGREHWAAAHEELTADRRATLDDHRSENRLTPQVLSDALNAVVDEQTVVVDEAVTNSYGAVQPHLTLSEPGSYFGSHGSGLGWCGGAPIGVKLAKPDHRVISVVGDGAYVFGNPTASTWVQGAFDAPVLTVVYNNSGWNAVKASTERAHPSGKAAEQSVPESKFDPSFDLTHAAHVVDSHTETVTDPDELQPALEEAAQRVDDGIPAVVDVKIEKI